MVGRFFAATLLLLLVLGSACDGDEDAPSPSSQPTTPAATNSPSASPALTSSPAVTENPSPTVTGQDWPVFDSDSGVSFPVPPGLVSSESGVEVDLQNGQQVTATQTLFRNADNAVVLSFVVTPNPEGLDLDTWIETYPGWPGDSSLVEFDGSPGLLFEADQAGDANATVYFAVGSNVFSLRGNTGTTGGSGGPKPPTLDRAEFTRVIEGITIESHAPSVRGSPFHAPRRTIRT